MNEYSNPQNMYAPTCGEGKAIKFSMADGAYLYDENQDKYIDLWNGFGSVVLGYNDKDIIQNVSNMIHNKMMSIQAPNDYIKQLKSLLLEDFPFKSHVGIFTTGTNAVRAATLAAIEYSRKDIILSAGYHGWDPMWQKGNQLFEANKYQVIDFYYIIEEFEKMVLIYKDKIAAVVISPDISYLSDNFYERLFQLCKEYKLLVIVDDVKCGYRYGVGTSLNPNKYMADLYVVSKGIANGARISCVIGNENIMRCMSEFCYTSYYDLYPVISAITTLKKIKSNKVPETIREKGDILIEKLRNKIAEVGLSIAITGNGNLFQFVLGTHELNEAFYTECVKQKICMYKDDNQCPSYAFNDLVLKETLERFHLVFEKLAEQFPNMLGKKIPKERYYLAAYNQTDGCAEGMSYNEKIDLISNVVYGIEGGAKYK